MVITLDSTPSGIMEAASYLLTNHSLVAKAIERDEFQPEGDSDAVSGNLFLPWTGGASMCFLGSESIRFTRTFRLPSLSLHPHHLFYLHFIFPQLSAHKERVVGLGLTYVLRQIPLSKWKVLNHIISLFSFASLHRPRFALSVSPDLGMVLSAVNCQSC